MKTGNCPDSNNKKGIIFDMDGVIFDSERIWKEGFFAANEKFGLNFTESERQSYCGKDEYSIRKQIRTEHSYLNADEYRDFIINYFNDKLERTGAEIKKGFLELISWLKANDFAVGLATSAQKSRALKMFSKKGMDIYKIFDAVVCGDDVKISKPNPEIFLLAAERINCLPARCIVLEDSPNGIEAARRAGMKAVVVKDLIPPSPEDVKKCVFCADNLLQVLDYFKACAA